MPRSEWRSAVQEQGPKAPDATNGALETQALVVSHWFDSGVAGEPYSATIRLTGRRIGSARKPTASDLFVREDTIDGIVPGSGPVSVSTCVYGLEPGEWTVSGEVIRPARYAAGQRLYERRQRDSSQPIQPAAWSWRRWAVFTSAGGPVKTRWAPLAPFARLPAVLPGSWPALGILGIAVALITQATILAHENVSVSLSLAVSLIVTGASLIAAKLWYALLHPGPWRQWIGGWSVDGFVFVGPPVAVVALLASGLPIGVFLDATMPGLFVGVAIGRLGCFFTGCCAGHLTRSRWGVWSSDRRVGGRRVPAQLLESLAGLAIAAVAALLVLGDVPLMSGVVFVASFTAYIVVRQFLLRVFERKLARSPGDAGQRRAPPGYNAILNFS